MTRLIVKNLPKTITEEKLRSIFTQKGTVTDIQLKYTKDGKFRQFAFIGYQSEDEAESALKYFNNSCIQTSRIKIEKCAPLGAQDKPKAWSKYAIDSSAYRKKHGIDVLEEQDREKEKKEIKTKKKNAVDEIFGKHKDDPEFKEFLEAHDRNRLMWGNDASLIDHKDDNDNKLKTSTVIKKEENVASSSSDEEKHTTKSNDSDKSDEDEEKADEDQEGVSDTDKKDEKVADKSISDLEYMKSLMKKDKNEKPNTTTTTNKEKTIKSPTKQIDLFTIKIHGIPYKTKRQEIIQFFKPNKPYSVRLPTKVHGFCYVGFKTEKEFKKAMLKHKSFIKGKQIFLADFTEKNKISKKDKEKINEEEVSSKKNSKWAKQEEALKSEEDISESGRIFFRNLSYTITEDDLQELFEKYGPVAEINLPIDPLTRQIKGFGTVAFVMPEHAVKAFNELDGTILHGRILHLIPGKSKDENEDDENADGLSFKAKKALKLKQSAQQTHNWNTLFLGANAVAEILAKQFGETKETILDTKSGGSSAAVRLALGETQIVAEMKRFLEENDVQLNVFDVAPQKRSKTVILAKNLPSETTVAELMPLFSKHGLLGRIVLPPSGVTALIEFHDPSEARKAFKKLAYSKFKNLPLYLEWAPENTFRISANSAGNTALQKEDIKKEEKENVKEEIRSKNKKNIEKQKESGKNNETTERNYNEDSKTNVDKQKEEYEDAADADEPPEEGTTIFLRNLNFKTREDAIRKHFKHLGAIHIIQVAMKKDPENPKNRIPLGYGFIQFKKRETANRALKEMIFTQIEGNQVELKPSDRTLKMDVRTNKKPNKISKQTGTKIVVRNIPFQAKSNEIKELFQAFGHIKSVRLPKKAIPGEEQHRGFGFVDFFDKSSAKKAFDALCQSTHLYGRRLVLEWAATDDNNVDELRKRTAKDYVGSETQVKKSRKAIFDSTKISDTKENDDDDDDDDKMEE